MKKKLAFLMAAVMSLSLLGGCGSNDTGVSTAADSSAATVESNTEAETSSVTSTGNKQLVVQVGPDPETIDPTFNSAVDGADVIIHLFEGLLVYGEDGQVAPGQAESWDVSEDGLTWTFHLREGLKWSDGSDLNANDFVYTWKRLCNPEIAAPYADTVLNAVVGFEEAIKGDMDALGVFAPDDLTLVVELSQPCSYFDSLAAYYPLGPVQQATVEANGDSWATLPDTYISNGAFVMTEWVPGSHITISKNPNYWNADAITLDSIKFVLMEDSNAAYSAYQTGEVMFIKSVPTEEIPSLIDNEDFYVDPIMGTYYLSFSMVVEPYTDPLVREALSLAIDRDYIANTLMQGTYSAASNFVGPGWLDTDGTSFMDNANGGTPYVDINNHENNLAKAKELLAEAGYPDGAGLPTVKYATNDAGYHKVVAEYLQQAWGELGLTVQIDIVEWASFTTMRRNGDYQIARNGWVGAYNDPVNLLELYYSTNGNNDAQYADSKFDAQIDISRTTTDAEERSAALHAAEDILMNETVLIPIAYYNDYWLQNSKITGSWHSASGLWYFMYADIAE